VSLVRRVLGGPRAQLVEQQTSQEPQVGDGTQWGALHYAGVGGVEWGGDAKAFPAVFASIRVISETVGTLPLLTYRRTSTGRERLSYDDDPRVRLLHEKPNDDQTAVEFYETVLGIVLQRGRCPVWVDRRDFYGRPASLRALDPRGVKLRRDEDGTRWWQIGWDERTAPRADEPDIIMMSGFMGLSPIAVCREAVRLGLNAQRYGAKLWENDSRPGGYLKTERELSDAAYERLKAQWAAGHQGIDNAHRFGLLEGGLSWQDVGIAPEDAQFLQTRQFQVTEVARMFRLPPHKIGDLSRATFSNIEHQNIDFAVDSIRPWCVRLEQRLRLGVFGDPRDRDLYSEFLLDGLMRGDTTSRYEAYSKAPWMSDNEKRQRENLQPLPGLDATYAPLNMARILDGEVQPAAAGQSADQTAGGPS
jgi:HK97 family phage portal protein